jgi:sulfur carrier protein ThiS
MKVRVKTGGLLGQYLPPGSARNSAEIDVGEDATPLDVMRHLGLPLEQIYLVSLNGTLVHKGERGRRRLADGDQLVIMPPLRGG